MQNYFFFFFLKSGVINQTLILTFACSNLQVKGKLVGCKKCHCFPMKINLGPRLCPSLKFLFDTNVQISNLRFWTQSKSLVWTNRNSYQTPSKTAVTLCMVWKRQGRLLLLPCLRLTSAQRVSTFPQVGEKPRGCGQTRAGSRLYYWCLAMRPFLVCTASTAASLPSFPRLGELLSVGRFDWLPSDEN